MIISRPLWVPAALRPVLFFFILHSMTLRDIALMRMYNQGIEGRKFKKPEDVVAHMGAMQAQDFNGALWAVALRTEKPDIKAVEKALAKGAIIRTWPMRGTLHFLSPKDARWMLDLIMPRMLKVITSRSLQHHGVDEKIIARAKQLITKALKGGKAITRPEYYKILEDDGISTKNYRGLHILGRLAHEQVVCFGPLKEKKQTFVLFDEWVKGSKKLSREDSIKELAIRYFTSHGPAQIQDLNWWSGLPMRDIKQGIEVAGKKLTSVEVEGKTYYMPSKQSKVKQSKEAHLLPPFDEFLVAYRDRDASLEKVHAQHVNPGANGMFAPLIVINGQVVGTWRKKPSKGSVVLTPHFFTPPTPVEKKAFEEAAEKYKDLI